MLINHFINFTQNLFSAFYQKSAILKNLDSLIFINIIVLILFLTVANSDIIAYFALSVIILTIINLIY